MGSRVRSWGLWLGVMLAMLAAPAAHARELKVLVMGDSLSAAYGLRADQGWVPLADAKSARYAFHNASLSGETSAGGRSRIAAEVRRVRPDIVVIELGANLGWMIGTAQAAGARVLLVGLQLPPNFGRYATDFQRSYVLISQRLGTGLVPHFLAPLGTERRWFQADNLHPVAAAQPLLAEQVLKALDALPPR